MPENLSQNGRPSHSPDDAKFFADLAAKKPEALEQFQQDSLRFEAMELERQLLREIQGRLMQIRSQIKGIQASDLRADIITDPQDAAFFAQSHATLNRAIPIVETLLQNDPIADKKMRSLIRHFGAFIEQHYTPQFEAQRLANPATPEKGGWVMSIARGKPVSRLTLQPLPDMRGGFAEMFVPPDDESFPLEESVRLDPARDVIDNDKDVIRDAIEKNPALAAWGSDIGSLRGIQLDDETVFEGDGFARTAMDASHRRIEEISLQRRIPIQWVLSAILEVSGLRDEGGSLVRRIQPRWESSRSLGLHTRDREVGDVPLDSHVLGKQMDRRVPVKMPDGRVFFIEANWTIVAQELLVP